MRNKTKEMAEIAIFSALIIILQVIATFINNGSFPITLTLIPIIVAGCVYGEKIGALMGLVFGLIVLTMVITGADPNSYVMFTINPLATIAVCIVKGVLCGYISALLFKLIYKSNKHLAVIVAAIACPIVNTLTFYIFLILFFSGTFAAMLGAFLSFNFVIELVINAALAPGLTNLILRNKKRYE